MYSHIAIEKYYNINLMGMLYSYIFLSKHDVNFFVIILFINIDRRDKKNLLIRFKIQNSNELVK